MATLYAPRNSPRSAEGSHAERSLGQFRPLATWPDTALGAVLAILAVIPYANTLLNGFVYDDITQVTNNPYLRSFRHLPEIFSTTVWSYVGTQGVTNYYRPMMTLGYLICYQIFGPVAFSFHLMNMVIHAAVVLILFALTRHLVGDRRFAFLASLVFALHPIHVESVAWIAAVTDLELSLFYLLAFWCYLRAGDRPLQAPASPPSADRSSVSRPAASGRISWQIGMALCFILALLSKEQSLTLPFLATVWEHFFRSDRRQTTWKQKLGRYGVLWLLAAAYLAFRVHLFGSFAPASAHPKFSWTVAVLSDFALVGQYLGKLLWPAHLNAFYVFHKSGSWHDPRVLAGMAVLAMAATVSIALYRRFTEARADSAGLEGGKDMRSNAPIACFGILWLFVTLSPVLNARWMPANVFTERYLYLPSVGFCWIVASASLALWDRASGRIITRRYALRAAVASALALALLLSVFRIWTRDRDWHDNVTLFKRTLASSPDAFQIRNNLGVVYWGQGAWKDAEQEWRQALKGDSNNVIVLTNLGLVCTKQKRYGDAVEFFKRAIELKPEYTNPHLGLGVAEEEMGHRREAQEQYEIAVRLSPLNVEARNRLGKLYLEAGRVAEAETQFAESVRSEANAQGYDSLGDIALERGNQKQAMLDYQAALEAHAFDSHAHFQLGFLSLEAGRTNDALRHYQAGLETDPSNPEALAAVAKLTAKSKSR